MLARLAKLAAVSALLRSAVEKRAGVVGKTLKIIGKTALDNPGKTTFGIGASVASVGAYKEHKKGFDPNRQMAGPTLPPPGAA